MKNKLYCQSIFAKNPTISPSQPLYQVNPFSTFYILVHITSSWLPSLGLYFPPWKIRTSSFIYTFITLNSSFINFITVGHWFKSHRSKHVSLIRLHNPQELAPYLYPLPLNAQHVLYTKCLAHIMSPINLLNNDGAPIYYWIIYLYLMVYQIPLMVYQIPNILTMI